MLEEVLFRAIDRSLSKYVHVDRSQLRLSLWQGNVSLANLAFKNDALAASDTLPLAVRHGSIESLTIQLPSLNSLASEPVRCAVSGIDLVLGPRPPADFDPAAHARQQRQALEDAELVRASLAAAAAPAAAATTEEEQQHETDTFVTRLVDVIVNNLQITVERVSVRYQDGPFELALALDSFTVQSTDADWRPAFSQVAPGQILHKLVRLDALSVRTNTGDLLRPVSATLRLRKLGSLLRSSRLADIMSSPTTAPPKWDVAIQISSVAVLFSAPQYAAFRKLSHAAERFRRCRRYQRHRIGLCDLASKLPRDRARARWQFAIAAVRADVAAASWTWDALARRRTARQQYVALYVQKLRAPRPDAVPADVLADLEALESAWPVSDVVLFRSLAEIQVSRMPPLPDASPASAPSPAVKPASWGSWFGSMVGAALQPHADDDDATDDGDDNGDGDDDDDDEFFDAQESLDDEFFAGAGQLHLSPKERTQLLALVGGGAPLAAASQPTVLPPEYVRMVVKCSLDEASLTLVSASSRDLVRGSLRHLTTSVAVQAETRVLKLALESIEVLHPTSGDVILQRSSANSDQELFFVQADLGTDTPRVAVALRPTSALYVRECVADIVAFFMHQDHDQARPAPSPSAVAQAAQPDRVRMALEDPPALSLDIQISAPTILLPTDDPNAPLELHLGHFSVTSTAADRGFDLGITGITTKMYGKPVLDQIDVSASFVRGQDSLTVTATLGPVRLHLTDRFLRDLAVIVASLDVLPRSTPWRNVDACQLPFCRARVVRDSLLGRTSATQWLALAHTGTLYLCNDNPADAPAAAATLALADLTVARSADLAVELRTRSGASVCIEFDTDQDFGPWSRALSLGTRGPRDSSVTAAAAVAAAAAAAKLRHDHTFVFGAAIRASSGSIELLDGAGVAIGRLILADLSADVSASGPDTTVDLKLRRLDVTHNQAGSLASADALILGIKRHGRDLSFDARVADVAVALYPDPIGALVEFFHSSQSAPAVTQTDSRAAAQLELLELPAIQVAVAVQSAKCVMYPTGPWTADQAEVATVLIADTGVDVSTGGAKRAETHVTGRLGTLSACAPSMGVYSDVLGTMGHEGDHLAAFTVVTLPEGDVTVSLDVKPIRAVVFRPLIERLVAYFGDENRVMRAVRAAGSVIADQAVQVGQALEQRGRNSDNLSLQVDIASPCLVLPSDALHAPASHAVAYPGSVRLRNKGPNALHAELVDTKLLTVVGGGEPETLLSRTGLTFSISVNPHLAIGCELSPLGFQLSREQYRLVLGVFFGNFVAAARPGPGEATDAPAPSSPTLTSAPESAPESASAPEPAPESRPPPTEASAPEFSFDLSIPSVDLTVSSRTAAEYRLCTGQLALLVEKRSDQSSKVRVGLRSLAIQHRVDGSVVWSDLVTEAGGGEDEVLVYQADESCDANKSHDLHILQPVLVYQPEPIFGIYDFFVNNLPAPEGKSPAQAQEAAQPAPPAPPAALASSRLQISVMGACVSLVGPRDDAGAIEARMTFCLGHATSAGGASSDTNVSLVDLQVCARESGSDARIPIVDPVAVRFEVARGDSIDIKGKIDVLDARISYTDLRLCTYVLESSVAASRGVLEIMHEQAAAASTASDAGPEELSADELAAVEGPEPPAEQAPAARRESGSEDETMGEGEAGSGSAETEPVTPLVLTVKMEALRITILDDSRASAVTTPLVAMTSPIWEMIATRSATGSIEMAADYGVAVQYFNSNLAMWEPLVEPWRFALSYSSRDGTVTQSLFAPGTLNVNVTPFFVNNVVGVLQEWVDRISKDATYDDLGYRASQSIRTSMVYFDNQLDDPVTVWLTDVAEPLVIQAHECVPLNHGGRTFARQLHELPPLESLDMQFGPFARSNKIAVRAARTFQVRLREATTDADAQTTKASVLVRIAVEGGARTIRVSSPIEIANVTSVALSIGVVDKQTKQVVPLLDELEPGAQMPLPFFQTWTPGALVARPAAGDMYKWGETAAGTLLGLPDLAHVHRSSAGSILHAHTNIRRTERGSLVVCKEAGPGGEADEEGTGKPFWFSVDVSLANAVHPVVSIGSPVRVTNLLPRAIQYLLREDGREDSKNEVRGTLGPGGESHCYRMDPRKSVTLAIMVAGSTEWSTAVPIGGGAVESAFMQHGSTRVSMENAISASGARHVTLYASFWIVNKTCTPLKYRGSDGTVFGHAEFASAAERDLEDAEVFPMTLFERPEWTLVGTSADAEFTESVFTKLSVMLGTSSWSNAIDVERVQSGSVVELENERGRCELAVTVEPAPRLFRHSKVVTFAPRFVLVNRAEQPVRVGQEGSRGGVVRAIGMAPGEAMAFHWTDRQHRRQICLQIAGQDYAWSRGFSIDFLGDFFVKLRATPQGAGRPLGGHLLLWVHVSSENGTHYVSFRSLRGVPAPYSLRNNHRHEIKVRQHLEGAAAVPWDHLPAKSESVPFCWDEPSLESRRLEVDFCGRVASINPDLIGTVVKIEAPNGRILCVSVVAQGPTKLVHFGERALRAAVSVPALSGRHKGAARRQSQVMAGMLDTGTATQIHLDSVGLSVMTTGPRELLYARAEELHYTAVTTGGVYHAEVSLGHVQVDNSLAKRRFPAVLVGQEQDEVPFAKAETKWSLMENAERGQDQMSHCIFAFLALQPVIVQLEEDFLSEAIRCHKAMSASEAPDAAAQASDALQLRRPSTSHEALLARMGTNADDLASIVVEEAFENQRRLTVFTRYSSRNLYPTDRRGPWSDRRGRPKNRDEFALPSHEWEWQGEWRPYVQGSDMDEDGWMYAIDFTTGRWGGPSTFGAHVRRRRWIRTRVRRGHGAPPAGSMSLMLASEIEASRGCEEEADALAFLDPRKLYVHLVQILPVVVRVTLAPNPARTTRISEFLVAMQRLFGPYVKNLFTLDNRRMKFRSLTLSNVYATQSLMATQITGHYIREATGQFIKVMTSADFLGDPIGLIRGIRIGVTDVVWEPAQGLVQGPHSFVTGLERGTASLMSNSVGGLFTSASKLTSFAGRALTNATFDRAHIERRYREEAKPAPRNIQEGIVDGGRALSQGILRGVSGVVTQPVRALQREQSAGSFFKGVGRGAVGLVVKPMAGVMDFASKTTQGIANAAIKTGGGRRARELEQQRRSQHEVRRRRRFGDYGLLLVYEPALSDDAKEAAEQVAERVQRTEALAAIDSVASASTSAAAVSAVQQQHQEQRRIYEQVYENQRRLTVWTKYSKANITMADFRGRWSSAVDGKALGDKLQNIPAPEGWRWVGEWEPVADRDGTDPDGWEYAFNWGTGWMPKSSATTYVRRREWRRAREIL